MSVVEQCFLTPKERLRCVALLGRYAPGITDIRGYTKVDIVVLYNEVINLVNKENEPNKNRRG